MALYQLHFFTLRGFYNFSFSSKPTKSHIKWIFHQNSVHGGVTSASSAEKPSVLCRKKERSPRAVMSDEDLCKELREIMFEAGLPADRVPLMKELSENGRKDLANIVGRRGYKAVWKLLSTSNLSDNHRENSVKVQEHSDPEVSGSIRESRSLKGEQLLDRGQVGNQGKISETNEELSSNLAVTEDNSQTEIDHLTALLRQKEMEFAELKQHIEKEKQTLTLLQARAQNEIGNVHRDIWTKDAELRAAEDELSGLKEVQVKYWVNGETVEVSGSYNGWHNQIKMDLHPSSKTVDSQGSRESKLWSTILWLYPGTYEIKFIVDGQWRIDPEREVSTNGHITNNVLTVDR